MTRKIRRKYSSSFKSDAVSLVLEQGYTVDEAATRLDVSSSALGKWVRLKKAEKADGLSFDEREELIALRKETKRLKMERDILKKAAVFFATDPE